MSLSAIYSRWHASQMSASAMLTVALGTWAGQICPSGAPRVRRRLDGTGLDVKVSATYTFKFTAGEVADAVFRLVSARVARVLTRRSRLVRFLAQHSSAERVLPLEAASEFPSGHKILNGRRPFLKPVEPGVPVQALYWSFSCVTYTTVNK